MQTPKRFYVVIAAVSVVIAGCESNAEKLKRLQTREMSECLNEEAAMAIVDSLRPLRPQTDSEYLKWGKKAVEHHTNCQLARRDLNLFMNGR